MNDIFFKLKTNIPSAAYLIILVFLYAIAASQAVWSFSYKWTTIVDHGEYSLEKTLSGEWPKPYAYRLLVPMAINVAVDIIPPGIQKVLIERSRLTLESTVGISSSGGGAPTMSDQLVLAYAIIIMSNFLFMFFSMILLRRLARDFILISPTSRIIFDFSPIIFSLLLTISYRAHNGYIYDFSEYLILILYIFLVKNKKSILGLILLGFAILNKETAIFLPLFGAIIRWYEDKSWSENKTMISLLEIYVVAIGFVVIRFMLRDHEGLSTEWHFDTNLKFWFSLAPWLAVTTPHIPLIPLPKPSNILVLIPLAMVVFGYWKSKSGVIKSLLLVSGFLNIPLVILFCYKDEYRNMSLMFPFFYLASVHTICKYFEGSGCR
jgi:hypothetical protein